MIDLERDCILLLWLRWCRHACVVDDRGYQKPSGFRFLPIAVPQNGNKIFRSGMFFARRRADADDFAIRAHDVTVRKKLAKFVKHAVCDYACRDEKLFGVGFLLGYGPHFLANVKDEPRGELARLVALHEA